MEGMGQVGKIRGGAATSEEQKKLVEERKNAGPRLMSCSDDHSIRLWRRLPKERADGPAQSRLPSIWKNRDFEEEWVEETGLPAVHERPIYAVSWSRKTGRVASTGSDGKIIVYEERWRGADASGDVSMADTTSTGQDQAPLGQNDDPSLTEWVVVAQVDNAHDVFEVNHVVWAPRADKEKGSDDEEVLISTGDDGEVRVWRFQP